MDGGEGVLSPYGYDGERIIEVSQVKALVALPSYDLTGLDFKQPEC